MPGSKKKSQVSMRRQPLTLQTLAYSSLTPQEKKLLSRSGLTVASTKLNAKENARKQIKRVTRKVMVKSPLRFEAYAANRNYMHNIPCYNPMRNKLTKDAILRCYEKHVLGESLWNYSLKYVLEKLGLLQFGIDYKIKLTTEQRKQMIKVLTKKQLATLLTQNLYHGSPR